MIVIGWSNLNVIVALVNSEFNAYRCVLGLQDSLLALQFVDMFSEYFLQKSVRACFLSCSFWAVKDHMLRITTKITGKSLVSAS